ncbi:MAG: Lipoprotein-releasing system transmembrane protein LolE [Alphaproteobacteria bacterium MarineAlpha5_Bin11]|nr:MAG: Lipoprotein-releasing system transmembrane protein LolE [Alphaproteobacteria bacterium MarineAlpha5_Bin11]
MIQNFEYILFKRFFFSKKNEGLVSIISWFSFIGIAIGVSVLIIVMSVMNGFRDELIKRIIGINGHINIYSSSGVINYNDYKLIKSNPSLSDLQFNAIVELQGLIIADEKSKGVFIRGMKSTDLKNKNNFSSKIKYGRFYKDELNEMIIGEELARILNITIYDKIKIAIPKTDKTIFGNIPRFKTMTVSGIFDVDMYEYDSSFVYIPTEIAQNLLLLEYSEINNIEIFTKNADLVDDNLKLLTNSILVNKFNNLYPVTWKDRNKNFIEALKTERNVMFLILLLIILIASLNIISGLVIFVKDKNKEIGILRTMGMSRFSVMKIFFLIGSTIGIIGTIIGVLFGILFCINITRIQGFLENLFNANLFSSEIYYLSSLPARIDYFEVMLIAILGLLLTFLSTIYPALKSSKINPIEVIRNE